MRQAGAEQGRAAAIVIMPPLPGECRRSIEHAVAGLGDNAVIVLARERSRLDRANGVIGGCAQFYDTVKAGLEGK